jgi:uncharacterized protein YbjQ (UPF0145 family)
VLIVTMDTVPGCTVRAVLGEVHGVTARQRNAYADGVQHLNGAMNPQRDRNLSQCRDQAIAELRRLARARGANAVVGMRFDHRDIDSMWTEICAYGTAVVVSPAPVARAAGRRRLPARAVPAPTH